MRDNAATISYLLHRWSRTPNKRTSLYSVRMPDGSWRHTMVDRARVWSLVIELGRRVVETWITKAAA